MRSHGHWEASPISIIVRAAILLVYILQIAIFLRAILSWFPMDQGNPLIRILNEITEPILAPLRKVVPRVGMIDITPMVAFVVLIVIQEALGTLPVG